VYYEASKYSSITQNLSSLQALSQPYMKPFDRFSDSFEDLNNATLLDLPLMRLSNGKPVAS